MLRKTQNSGDKSPISILISNRWLTGMVAGLLLGFAVALLVVASVPPLLISMAVGGIVGGLAGTRQKPKKLPVRDDKRIRAYVFQALEATNKKLKEIIIDEQFNGASSGEKDRRSMKTATPQPKLFVPPPAPPKMGGL